MFRKKTKTGSELSRRTVLSIAVVILLAAVGLRIKAYLAPPELPTALIALNSASFTAEIAATPELREKGLGGREALPRRHAMYFPFPTEGYWVFWMKDMRFPIDIIWIREGVVVDVARHAPIPKNGVIERFSPDTPADAVLEVNAGVADELNVKDGDRIRIVYPEKG